MDKDSKQRSPFLTWEYCKRNSGNACNLHPWSWLSYSLKLTELSNIDFIDPTKNQVKLNAPKQAWRWETFIQLIDF